MAPRVQAPIGNYRQTIILTTTETFLAKVAHKAHNQISQIQQLLQQRSPQSKPTAQRENRPSEISTIAAYNDNITTLEFNDLPPNSLLLGICDDGLPLRLDLDNPVAGSILVSGDPGSGKTQLLQGILTSILAFEPIKELTISIIAHDPQEYNQITQTQYCQDVSSLVHRNARMIIRTLMLDAEQRRSEPDGPIRLLVIDDLARLLQSVDDETFGYLYRLIKHGPRYHIWTIASLSTRYAEYLDQRLLDAFRTHILGHIDDKRVAELLGRDLGKLVQSLTSPDNFIASLGMDWISFMSPKNAFALEYQEDDPSASNSSDTVVEDTPVPIISSSPSDVKSVSDLPDLESPFLKKGIVK